MSDAEALEELAKALNHTEKAMDAADSEEVLHISERGFEQVSDRVQELVQEVGSHE